MLSELHEDYKALALSMRAVHALCDDAGDVATASLLENWIDQSQRRSWFLFEATRSLSIFMLVRYPEFLFFPCYSLFRKTRKSTGPA